MQLTCLKECYIPTPNALVCKQYGWPRYFRLWIWQFLSYFYAILVCCFVYQDCDFVFCLSGLWFCVLSICVLSIRIVILCFVYQVCDFVFCLSGLWFCVLSIRIVILCFVYLDCDFVFCLSGLWFCVLSIILIDKTQNHNPDRQNTKSQSW
jgi:hypothetical protein